MHTLHRLAWDPMLVGLPDNHPACPCVTTVLPSGTLLFADIPFQLYHGDQF